MTTSHIALPNPFAPMICQLTSVSATPLSRRETVRFVDEDFSGVDFDQFVMGFFVFQNCNLDDAKHIYGQPIYFTDSSVRNVDFRGVKAIIEAEDCDFRGMKYDEETQFVYGSGKLAARSRFINCKLDDETRDFLSQQGVEIS